MNRLRDECGYNELSDVLLLLSEQQESQDRETAPCLHHLLGSLSTTNYSHSRNTFYYSLHSSVRSWSETHEQPLALVQRMNYL
jgi:hypothetical protein